MCEYCEKGKKIAEFSHDGNNVEVRIIKIKFINDLYFLETRMNGYGVWRKIEFCPICVRRFNEVEG